MADTNYTDVPPERDLPFPFLTQQEAGAQHSATSAVQVTPCPDCGVAVLEGRLADGALVCVEIREHAAYCLVWASQERWPRLVESRAYPVHRCQPISSSPRQAVSAGGKGQR